MLPIKNRPLRIILTIICIFSAIRGFWLFGLLISGHSIFPGSGAEISAAQSSDKNIPPPADATLPFHLKDVLQVTPGDANIMSWSKDHKDFVLSVDSVDFEYIKNPDGEKCGLIPEIMADPKGDGGTLTIQSYTQTGWLVTWKGHSTMYPVDVDYDALSSCGRNALMRMSTEQVRALVNVLKGTATPADDTAWIVVHAPPALHWPARAGDMLTILPAEQVVMDWGKTHPNLGLIVDSLERYHAKVPPRKCGLMPLFMTDDGGGFLKVDSQDETGWLVAWIGGPTMDFEDPDSGQLSSCGKIGLMHMSDKQLHALADLFDAKLTPADDAEYTDGSEVRPIPPALHWPVQVGDAFAVIPSGRNITDWEGKHFSDDKYLKLGLIVDSLEIDHAKVPPRKCGLMPVSMASVGDDGGGGVLRITSHDETGWSVAWTGNRTMESEQPDSGQLSSCGTVALVHMSGEQLHALVDLFDGTLTPEDDAQYIDGTTVH
jgi:hypothetical protein